MKPVKARVTKGINFGSYIPVCDNSGAKVIRMFAVFRRKTTKGRYPSAGVGDMIMATVKEGKPEMKKQVVLAVIVRQKKEYRRPDGMRIAFEDNAAVVVKDKAGNPKGTLIKGPVAKEAASRWPGISKLANIIV
ncbi:50S ribosomal protein L14 [Candidatus Woesearchaeota archaeon]|nr:50S ribosomal protein L14 [Candidatus Woesearchaeota archaeon]RLE40877.1 MAG: 50S ribosomal protein L14 [Candidatus Woesearchaeota archaeon]